MEIERKWLLSYQPYFPDVSDILTVEQSYILTRPGELRIRRISNWHESEKKYCLTVKSDGELMRQEWEKEIPKWVYDLIANSAKINTIVKAIVKVPYGDLCLEFHLYIGWLSGLYIMECEFPDQESADSFKMPDWITSYVIKEVTDDQRYKNKNIAVYGLPK